MKYTVKMANQTYDIVVDKDGSFLIPDELRRMQGKDIALKPAIEDWWLVRKPLSEKNLALNVLKHGTGAINIDGCRVQIGKDDDIFAKNPHTEGGYGHGDAAVFEDQEYAGAPAYDPSKGRWPANLLLSHSDECIPVGTTKVKAISGGGVKRPGDRGKTDDGQDEHGNYGTYQGREYPKVLGFGDEGGTETVERWACVPDCPVRMLDAQSATKANPGGASRFFYVAKPSTRERELGCDHLKGPDGKRGNTHVTVKSVTLMRYLCRLITPPKGLILDPFAGSGTTGMAALREGFHFLGVEQDEQYATIAEARIKAVEDGALDGEK